MSVQPEQENCKAATLVESSSRICIRWMLIKNLSLLLVAVRECCFRWKDSNYSGLAQQKQIVCRKSQLA